MPIIPISSAPGYNSTEPGGDTPVLRLPVAPLAFCRMRHAPETKPGPAMNATEVVGEVGRYQGVRRVELDGPGDPLAAMPATLACVALLKQHYPEIQVTLTTVGLGAAERAAELAAAGIDGITLLIDTLDAATAEKLYAWVRPGKKTVPLKEVVPVLLDEQAKAIPALVAAGIPVTVRTSVYPGINAHQIAALAETMAELGAMAMELTPFTPEPTQSTAPAGATREHMEQLTKLTTRFLPTTTLQIEVADCGCSAAPCGCGTPAPVTAGNLPKPTAERPRVAVASGSGMDVDLHLGQTKTFLIYGPREDGLTCLLETRQAPDPGSGESRWEELADTLYDCFALLAASAGQRPRDVLGSRGIRVLLTEDNIEGTVDVLYGGGRKKK